MVQTLCTLLLAIPGIVIARALEYIRQLERETRDAVGSLAEVIDHRDASTYHHSERVALYAVSIAQELRLDEGMVELVRQAATVPDLGKIGVPDRVLLKPGPLNAEERMAMWLHSEIGARILGGFRLFGPGAAIVRHHHESFDGTGYPDGLAGQAIPLGARVVAVADALDAMTSDRPYRRALSGDEALSRFRDGAGRQWDPVVIEAMLTLVESGRLDLAPSGSADAGDFEAQGGPADGPRADGRQPESDPPAVDTPGIETTERPAARGCRAGAAPDAFSALWFGQTVSAVGTRLDGGWLIAVLGPAPAAAARHPRSRDRAVPILSLPAASSWTGSIGAPR
jgi:hypothetical protein